MLYPLKRILLMSLVDFALRVSSHDGVRPRRASPSALYSINSSDFVK
jgi:hypothetical protein